MLPGGIANTIRLEVPRLTRRPLCQAYFHAKHIGLSGLAGSWHNFYLICENTLRSTHL